MTNLTPRDVETLLDDLAQLLPFPTTLYVDMGAEEWTVQLYYGPVDPDSELPIHRVGIDAHTVRPVLVDRPGRRKPHHPARGSHPRRRMRGRRARR